MTKRITVKFQVDVPDDMPLDAAHEWIAFEVGARGDMKLRHPQMDRNLEPIDGSFDCY